MGNTTNRTFPRQIACQQTGINVEALTYPGDLFDFDMEVQSVLEVLVDFINESSDREMLEEEELVRGFHKKFYP